MGKKNKVVKLTDRKIRYIIRAKKRGDSTKRIAEDLKLSLSSVKRVWMHWTKTKMQLNIKKFGRMKKILDEESVKLILEVHKEAMAEYGWLTSIREVLTDRGTQFYASNRNKNGDADSRFEDFLRANKIKHIKARVKHPQTNGKLEKLNDTYELNRFRFENFDNLVNWYNTIRFHGALDTKWYLQTPDNAFWSRLPDGCKLGMFLNRMETELND